MNMPNPRDIKDINLVELVFMKGILRYNIESNYSEATLWNPTLDPKITERSKAYGEECKARDNAKLELIQVEIKSRIEEICKKPAT